LPREIERCDLSAGVDGGKSASGNGVTINLLIDNRLSVWLMRKESYENLKQARS
jgi:hypothetical protein